MDEAVVQLQQLRQECLIQAVKVHAQLGGEADEIVATAEAFRAFVQTGTVPMGKAEEE